MDHYTAPDGAVLWGPEGSKWRLGSVSVSASSAVPGGVCFSAAAVPNAEHGTHAAVWLDRRGVALLVAWLAQYILAVPPAADAGDGAPAGR